MSLRSTNLNGKKDFQRNEKSIRYENSIIKNPTTVETPNKKDKVKNDQTRE